MTAAQTWEEFTSRSTATHKGKYAYPLQPFAGAGQKVSVTCADHGTFEQWAGDHLQGAGCPTCAKLRLSAAAKSRAKDYLTKIQAVSPQYDYSEFVSTFIKVTDKVKVICKQHGEFLITPSKMSKGQGCKACGLETTRLARTITPEKFLKRAKDVHGDLYDYSGTIYKDFVTKVAIRCSTHGDFQQLPSSHVTLKHGCPKCAQQGNADINKVTDEEFKGRCLEVHGSTYIYLEPLVSMTIPITILCQTHGEFKQLPYTHTQGQGCPACAVDRVGGANRITVDKFLERAKALNQDRYAYSFEGYIDGQSKVNITCKTHGLFKQTAVEHLRGSHCPKCAGTISAGQVELTQYVESLGFDITTDYKYGVSKREVDVYVPSKRLAIEFDGTYFHSSKFRADNYHLEKLQEVNAQGIDLIQVFSDEWELAKPQIKALIATRLGVSGPKVFARNCTIRSVSNTEAKAFYSQYHVQGWNRYGDSWGLEHDSKLVAVMTITAITSSRGAEAVEGSYELVRFASSIQVVGGASKLLANFVKRNKPSSIVSYSDNRLFSGGMYKKLGFVQIGRTRPSYTYVKNGTVRRLHKSHFRHASLGKQLGEGYNPDLTERENCERAGLYQVYDCGLTKWNYHD